MNTIDSLDEYIQKIIDTFNEHAMAYTAAVANDQMFEQALHAFMCNAINRQVMSSNRPELRERFAAETITD